MLLANSSGPEILNSGRTIASVFIWQFLKHLLHTRHAENFLSALFGGREDEERRVDTWVLSSEESDIKVRFMPSYHFRVVLGKQQE